ncbi:hypothetical protein [Undibacterium oligocarboniphilum]|uniref:Uncharacterized protein n=1 Tax=Undibacterium oligocarboniphilum TaxID=666702 RepID=A0A850QH71_9BURK|nr:hypothetical protein [Undibacterium oligocarboniphilum]MBC3871493.1 hypothetical protein [Undibacterium oligocarboniphilum]NVO78931.1 hypothetical protein [Undibacterium oligocarboniphilum]
MNDNIEKIPGAKAIGQRLANAELNFRETVRDLTSCSEEEALKAFNVMRKLKEIQLDSGGGRYNVIHGMYLEPEVLRNAINYPSSDF